MTLTVARVLLLVAAMLLGLGLTAPCMTIHPAFGPFDSWVKILKPDLFRPSQYSILGGIWQMIMHGNAGIGLLLLGFSVLFPTVKLAAMAFGAQRIAVNRSPGWMMRAAHHAGKWSMLDVLVLAVLIIAIKGLPGDTRITLGWGVWAFAASVVMSLLASTLIQRTERFAHAIDEP